MNKKSKLIIVSAVVLILVAIVLFIVSKNNRSDQKLQEMSPVRQDISLAVSTVGTVKPQNRLEIKPPINGRVDDILVEEGDEVKIGDILAFMSSTERATLMDAARIKGDQEFRYWQNAYKATPLVAPINGHVIVRDVEPGQTVTTANALIVLSDRLIVSADVDETDIGEVKLGQAAVIGLDAYPEIKIDAVVDHISYESQVVNNVTIYKVDILPVEVPEVFRSGMSANVEILVKELKDVLLIPEDALSREEGETYVSVKDRSRNVMKKVAVTIGMKKNNYVEIVSGLSDDDIILAPKNVFVAPKKGNGNSPFMPQFRGRGEKQK